EEGPATDARERPPDIRLEDDHHDDHHPREDGVEERPDGDEAGALREGVGDADEAHADGHLHRARAADDHEHQVDEHGGHGDVEEIPRDHPELAIEEGQDAGRECLEEPLEDSAHSPSPSVIFAQTRSAWRVSRTSWTRTARAPARAAAIAAAIDPPRRSLGAEIGRA